MIIIFHTGHSVYVNPILKHNSKMNKIVVICDSELEKKAYKHTNIEYVHYSNLECDKIKYLTDNMYDCNTNDYTYELNNYLRWVYIHNYLKTNDIQEFVTIADSDIAFFTNTEHLENIVSSGDYLCGMPGTNDQNHEVSLVKILHSRDYKLYPPELASGSIFVCNVQSLAKYLDILIYYYVSEKSNLCDYYSKLIKQGLKGGASDMVFFTLFYNIYHDRVLNLNNPVGNVAVDINIFNTKIYDSEIMTNKKVYKEKIKKISTINNKKYCYKDQRMYEMYNVHLQGRSKYLMAEYIEVSLSKKIQLIMYMNIRYYKSLLLSYLK